MAVNTANVLSLNTATTNVTTAAYVELTVSATGAPIACSQLVIANKTASQIKIAVGVSGSQTDLVAVLAGVQQSITVSLNVLPIGSHIWVEAIDATASTGYISVSLLP